VEANRASIAASRLASAVEDPPRLAAAELLDAYSTRQNRGRVSALRETLFEDERKRRRTETAFATCALSVSESSAYSSSLSSSSGLNASSESSSSSSCSSSSDVSLMMCLFGLALPAAAAAALFGWATSFFLGEKDLDLDLMGAATARPLPFLLVEGCGKAKGVPIS
jgi:hypothetical protein